MQSIKEASKILCLNSKRKEIVTKPNFFNFVVVSTFNFKNQPILLIEMFFGHVTNDNLHVRDQSIAK